MNSLVFFAAIYRRCRLHYVVGASLLLLPIGCSSFAVAQKSPAVQVLYDHLAGTWIGTNHEFSKTPPLQNQLIVHAARNAKKGRLELEYVYTMPGQADPDREQEWDVFDLAAGTLVRDRKRIGTAHLTLEHIDGLLQDGYGDYTAHCVVRWNGKYLPERIEYHLMPDSWSYEVYVNPQAGTWIRTGDWELKRTVSAP